MTSDYDYSEIIVNDDWSLFEIIPQKPILYDFAPILKFEPIDEIIKEIDEHDINNTTVEKGPRLIDANSLSKNYRRFK